MEDIYIDEAEEETLSLFEYSVNSTAAAESEWEDYCSPSIIKREEHYFEFCSNEWSATTVASNGAENIIFCGKILSYQEPTSGNDQNSANIREKRRKKPGLFQRKSKSKDTTKTRKEGPKSLSMPDSRKFSVHKISIVASPGKFRWYLPFGMTRFPMEMALRDIKNRQSRRIPTLPLFRMEGAEKKKVNGSAKGRGRGLWGKLRRWFPVARTKQTQS